METKRNSGLWCQQKATGARLLTQAAASRGHHQMPASHMTVTSLLTASPSNGCPTTGGNHTQHARHVPSRPSGQPCPGSNIVPTLNQGPRQPAPPRLLGAEDHSTLNKKKEKYPPWMYFFLLHFDKTNTGAKQKKNRKENTAHLRLQGRPLVALRGHHGKEAASAISHHTQETATLGKQ